MGSTVRTMALVTVVRSMDTNKIIRQTNILLKIFLCFDIFFIVSFIVQLVWLSSIFLGGFREGAAVWNLLCLSHLQQFGHCWCKKMEPMVCPALAVCLHSFQNLPHRLLHLRDSLQTIQFRPNLPALPDVVRDVGLETHAETLLYPWHGATNRNRC